MSSSIAATLMITFMLSISLPASAANSSTLIKTVCFSARKEYGLKSCEKLLRSKQRIASATNMFDLSVGIIKSGISRSKHTSRHLRSLIKKRSTNPRWKRALHECKLSYDLIMGSFRSALSEVKERDFQTATYDLLVASTDNVNVCRKAVESVGIEDEVVLKANEVVPVFGLSGFEAVGELDSR